jgi:hypothetical protein
MEDGMSYDSSRTKTFGCAVLLAGIGALRASAGMIDFSGLSDGVPVSDGNPYASVVYLQAVTEQVFLTPGALAPTTVTHDATVQGGEAAVVPQFVSGGAMYRSSLMADFVQPVTDVSFDVGAYRHGGYLYTAVNSAGDTITGTGQTGSGGLETPDLHHVSIDLPAGYSLSRLEIGNSDPVPSDAAIWVDNLEFQNVPDSDGSWLLLAGSLAAAGGFVGLTGLGRRRAALL